MSESNYLKTKFFSVNVMAIELNKKEKKQAIVFRLISFRNQSNSYV